MKIIVMAAALSLSLSSAACKKKQAAEAPNNCAAAVSRSMELSKEAMEKMGADAAMRQKMVDVGVQRCTEDKWSADAVKCMLDAKTMADAQGCYEKLTKEQQDKMNKAAEALGQGGDSGSGSGSAGSDTGSAAAGSDTGSAGSDTGSAGSDTGSASGSDSGSAADSGSGAGSGS